MPLSTHVSSDFAYAYQESAGNKLLLKVENEAIVTEALT